jgi:hypothetical protein
MADPEDTAPEAQPEEEQALEGLLGLSLDEGISQIMGAQSEAEPEELPEETTEEPAEEPDEQAPDVLLEIDGEPYTLEDLKAGNLRQSDYTKKTMALAEDRRAHEEMARETEALKAALQTERTQSLEVLQTIAQQWQDAAGPRPNREHYPDEGSWAIAMDSWRTMQEQRAAIEQRYAYTRHAMQQEQLAAKTEKLQAEENRILDRFPEWKDPEIRKSQTRELVDLARDVGFSQEEIAEADSRAVELLYWANKGKRAEAGKDKAIKKTAKAQPFLKAGARSAKPKRKAGSVTQLDKRLSETGTLDDAVSLMMARENGAMKDGRR